MIRKVGGIRSDFALPVIRGNGIEAVTNVEKAELLLGHLLRYIVVLSC